jgi:bifunctional ADP-heptose synthase (sugar kinase/adenylyltransferase)
MKDSKRSQQQKKYRVLLIGDNCSDIYRYGTVDRISPEAPVPIFKFIQEEGRAGMAGNVRNNLEALGLEVTCLTGNSSTKTRLIDVRSKQHILRIDDDVNSRPLLYENIDPVLFEVDAVVISDYEKGVVSYTLVKDIRDYYTGPIFVDTKKHDLEYFEGCYVKVNAHERALATSICTDLIVTRGEHGAEYKTIMYPAAPTEVVDVCGAGDTFISALTYQYLKTKNMDDAIKFAVKAGAVAVQYSGVYAPKLEEIQ